MGTYEDDEEPQEPLPAYTDPDCVQFVDDMATAGITVEHYHGRVFWSGPAARCDDLQDVMSRTRVRVQWDNMGMGYIVYPKASDDGGQR